jgi:hypothetical protein
MSSDDRFIKSITTIQDLPTTLTSSINNSENINTDGSWFSWQLIVIIILVLAILGFNIFTYLAKGTEGIADIIETIFGPILRFFGYATLQTTKQVIQTSAEGTTAGVDIVAGTAVSGINKLEDTSTNNNQNDNLDKALSNAKTSYKNVRPDEANSNIQYSGKSGWCYIGESNGTRTCAEVGVNDICMSGDIFPTNDVCVNPNLRA